MEVYSSLLGHWAKNVFLILLSMALLPLSTLIVSVSLALRSVTSYDQLRRRVRRSPRFRPKTVLVTGVGMTKGLRIARAFYETGHRVIGVDFEYNHIPVSGRFSASLAKFYAVSNPCEQHGASRYIRDLVYIIQKENVDLWVSSSGVGSAEEDGQAMEMIERKTNCKSIQFDLKTTSILHEKDSFVKYTESLGLPVPETHQVASRGAAHKILNDASSRRKRYIMKTTGTDDANRPSTGVVLPRRTPSQTYSHVSSLSVTESTPWILQEFIDGEEYCTHSIVVRGEVKLFVACRSSDLLMHYQALPKTSGLNRAMLRYTQEFARRAGPKLTGHLSFDFMVGEEIREDGVKLHIYPIECNPRAHTALSLFSGPKASEDMVKAYLSALGSPLTNGVHPNNGCANLGKDSDGGSRDGIASPPPNASFYWVGHDIVTSIVLPLLGLMTFKTGVLSCLQDVTGFVHRTLFWKDGFYEIWDPLPWYWQYHVWWPVQFVESLSNGKRWSRINVSTNKIFGC